MAESDVTQELEPLEAPEQEPNGARRPMPEMIDVDPTAGMPPHSAAETSLLLEQTGRDYQELAGEGADAGDQEAVLVWFTLRRLGYQPTWDEARNQLVRYVTPDPTSGEPYPSSPPSVTTGE